MSVKFGGLIGSVTTPTTNSAPGIWDVKDIYGNKFLNIWPAYLVPILPLAATGGTQTTGNNYNQWTFNSSGTWTVTQPGIAYYAIVAGGGSGGCSNGGGGGAGGVITGILSANAGTYTVVVGAGGAGVSSGTTSSYAPPTGNNGNISSLAGLSAVGGGHGLGSGDTVLQGFPGGSGGGGSSGGTATYGGQGVAGQGWAGGNNVTSGYYPQGGGGGAGGPGYTGSGSVAGNGGPGLAIYLPASGVSTYVGGGGGGGGAVNTSCTPGTGGIGGGSSGTNTSTSNNATPNTGGGGGGNGGFDATHFFAGGNGGSGVVYIWAPTANLAKTPYVQYLIVGGGGSGGAGVYGAGGGGAGGLIYGTTSVLSGTAYTITVGAGGAAVSSSQGNNGSTSGLSATGVLSLTALGGGGGGGSSLTSSQNNGLTGASGGGAGNKAGTGTAGAGTTGYGYGGGLGVDGVTTSTPAGGGGGYGTPGFTATGTGATPTNGGNGGDGGTFGIANGTGQNWSYRFNGTNACLNVPSNAAFNFGTGDFTVEVWVFPNLQGGHGSSNNDCIIDFRPNTSGGAYGTLFIANYGTYVGYYANASVQITGGAITNNTWNHIAISRISGSTKLFINGSQSGSTYTDSTNYGTGPVTLGQFYDGTGGGWFQGYMSNVRIVKGTGLYSTTFTPSTSALSAIAGTQLLTCQSPAYIDNSSNNFTISVSGSMAIASQNPFGISYAGGGAGGTDGGGSGTFGVGGWGGMGGGGRGGLYTTSNPTAGTTNTGSGGGGGANNNISGAGGSGVVILAYPSTYPAASSTTGSPSLSTINGNYIYKFTSSGTITF